MRLLASRLALSLALAACGARTGLTAGDALGDAGAERRDGGVDAGVDAGPPLPTCPDAVPAGSIRWRAAGVVVGAAFGPDGHVYAPVHAAAGAIELASFDRCTGALRWQRPAMPPPERPGTVRRPRARFTTAGDALLVNADGYVALYGVWRYGLDGEARPAYAIPERMVDFYAVPAGFGPIVRTYADEVSRTIVLALDGAPAASWDLDVTPASECVAVGERLVCYGAEHRIPFGETVWSSGTAELVDGTFRHVVPPAIDGDRLYAIVYGVSTYWLDALDRRDGARIFRVPLMRTTRGQTDLRLGRPVVGADGTVYVYANGHREGESFTGALHAFDRDGEERWRFVANASMQEFFLHGTHALGDAGLVYLAIGDAVYAIDARDGGERWALRPGTAFNVAQLALGPSGDLAVRSDGDELFVIATESRGLADGPWPAPEGDGRNANAR